MRQRDQTRHMLREARIAVRREPKVLFQSPSMNHFASEAEGVLFTCETARPIPVLLGPASSGLGGRRDKPLAYVRQVDLVSTLSQNGVRRRTQPHKVSNK